MCYSETDSLLCLWAAVQIFMRSRYVSLNPSLTKFKSSHLVICLQVTCMCIIVGSVQSSIPYIHMCILFVHGVSFSSSKTW